MQTNNGIIGKKRKKTGFTQISNTLLEDTRLSWRAKSILCYLMSRPNNWKINKTDLYNRSTEGRDAVETALKELKQFEYLHIYKNIMVNGQIDGWTWEYDDTPFTPDILKNQTTEKPQENSENVQIPRHLDFPSSGKPVMWNSSAYNNTDINNKDFNNTNSKEHKPKNIYKKNELELEFESLWKIYPRKQGKKQKAKESYIKAIKKGSATYETVKNGIEMYIKYIEYHNVQEEYIKHGSTFFSQECWDNDFTCKPKLVQGKRHGMLGLILNERDMHRKNIIDYEESIINDQGRNEVTYSQNTDSLPYGL